MKAFWDTKILNNIILNNISLNNTSMKARFGIQSVLAILFSLLIQVPFATAESVLVDQVIAIDFPFLGSFI